MSIFIHVPAGLTHHETSSYSVVMAFWCKVVLLVSLALCQPATALVFAAATPEQPESVPADEYPFYDLAVEAKFLTSRTRLVIIERMTSTRLHPEEPQLPTAAWFAEQGFFDGRLPQDLIRDFVARLSGRLDWMPVLPSGYATGSCPAKGCRRLKLLSRLFPLLGLLRRVVTRMLSRPSTGWPSPVWD